MNIEIEDHTETIRLDPKFALAFVNKAWAWLSATIPDEKFRDGKQAVELASKACELIAWQWQSFVGTLGAACAEAVDFDQAIEHQKRS